MTPERWQQIETLYLDASGLSLPERAALLAEKCAGDDALRQEVESLLEADRQSGSFLQEPPSQLAAHLLDSHPGALSPGHLVGSYEVRSLITVGGMGEVYAATDTRTGQATALKLLRRHLTIDPLAVQRFEREAHAAGALAHPNIVTLREFGTSEAGMFIAMEWVEGKTWRALFETFLDAAPLAEVGHWALQAARGLAAAHAAGIVHRDIKPDNIMLSSTGIVKILDFGLARLSGYSLPEWEGSGSTGTISGTLSGTLPYMSPELLRGETASSASDIFSFASVLYELFTGAHPFSGETPLDIFEAIECRSPQAPSTLRPGLPPGIDALILAMLHPEPGARPDAAAIVEQLSHLAFGAKEA